MHWLEETTTREEIPDIRGLVQTSAIFPVGLRVDQIYMNVKAAFQAIWSMLLSTFIIIELC
jgi:hypothetical protein